MNLSAEAQITLGNIVLAIELGLATIGDFDPSLHPLIQAILDERPKTPGK